MESNRLANLVSWLRISPAVSLDPHVGQAADAIEALEAENEKLREALIDAAGELQHAYIMGFTERYRYAARAARNAVAAVRESVDE